SRGRRAQTPHPKGQRWYLWPYLNRTERLAALTNRSIETLDVMQIPTELQPADGRFGSGPSKVRSEALEALAKTGTTLMGASHRQPPVKKRGGSVQEGVAEVSARPDVYEVVLGVGGATAFFAAATFGLVSQRSQHLVNGEFSRKFAKAVTAAPFLADPSVRESDFNTRPVPRAENGEDVYACAHNEPSTEL